MTKPERFSYKPHKLEVKQKLKNGVLYEHWHDTIDNEHHIHFPDGTLIIFGHEDSEGSVEIKEEGKT